MVLNIEIDVQNFKMIYQLNIAFPRGVISMGTRRGQDVVFFVLVLFCYFPEVQ